ncbi:glycosyl transferase family 2 [Caldalkalibacillus thermarum TA2.A1]|uniref:Glucosyl-3-phosphoglycerate synthase n=1 Tax=Caldalkalibacillus thermarum (strain TA2.A1) TaxID=986075 RepID=F5L3H8_CALTT|nr:glycosyltransferase family 2 protein [Caldalkalibacillus thermarum]EGL84108.1 glycosyl transferase family 2 [Caldalkalibacillus thermarum TA2.A1]QZT32666.1 glycosyltransferase family 2 protein [Caldalkalibacillus thermarum TA2.A1]GGK19139.1 glycosyl transferase [Caldalkalibacillus thermarum]
MDQVSIIIPAYNEEQYIGQTLSALLHSGDWFREIIVVDDGSEDNTFHQARIYTPHVIRLSRNKGKSAAMMVGVYQSSAPVLLFLDADLGHSASLAKNLPQPVQDHCADMTIAVLPKTKKGGLGLVKHFASWGIYRQTGVWLEAPLSGQRAVRKKQFLSSYKGDQGFGFEVGLTIDYLQAGLTIQEVEVPFTHRERGKTLDGFWHRFKQGLAVKQALKLRKAQAEAPR